MSHNRLLFVSPRFLFPLDQGGKIRTANILRNMRGGAFEITLASPAPTDWARFKAELRGICDHFVCWPEPRRGRLFRGAALVGNLPVAVASDCTPAGRRLVSDLLAAEPDLVLADFPHAAVLLPRRLPMASAMFTHNVEAEIYTRHAALARGIWRWLWQIQARKMRAFEGATLNRFKTVIAVSARDAEALERDYGLASVNPIDTGVDTDFYAYSSPSSAPAVPSEGGTVVFTGGMDWHANAGGIGFLLDEVWPLVVRARPRANALIVGRSPPRALVARARKLAPTWRFTGYVADVRPLVAAAHVYVVPLRVGSGTRIKVFEAMAMGRPVVSTAIGVEELDVEPGRHYLAADDAEAFASAILRLLADTALRERMAAAARLLVEQRFSWARIARDFEAICLNTLSHHGTCPSADRCETVERE